MEVSKSFCLAQALSHLPRCQREWCTMLSPSIESEKNATGATSSTSSSHDLESLTAKRSDTVVEQIAERIEKLRADRILITFNAQLCFLKGCREIVRSKGHHECRVTLQDLKDYRDRVQRYEIEADRAIFHRSFFNEGLGIMSDMRCLIRILDRAIELFENGVIQMDEWLYYNDFSFDYTRVVSKWPFARHPLGMSCLLLFSYYLFTPILFCLIASSSNICNADRGYVGWIDALYFASSTVRILSLLRSNRSVSARRSLFSFFNDTDRSALLDMET